MKLIFIFLLIALFAFSKSIDLNDFRIISLPSFSPILIQKTEKFALKLKSNPSTGYQWYVKNENDLDKSLLFIKSNETNFGEYEGNAKNGYLIGAGGSSYFKFENLNNNTKEVEVAINFEYKRTWELAAIQDFTANVTLA